jgi:RimJ/RimL family protein N-acetyltransferase
MTSAPLSSPAAARGTPLHIEAGGYVLRTLEPSDATPAMLDWLQSPTMLAGLNLPPISMTLDQLRAMIARSDCLNTYFIGIYTREMTGPVGFYQLAVNQQHRAALLTAGVGVPAYLGKDVLYSTVTALVQHFFAAGTLDKISARVIARNRRALYSFWKSGTPFVPEGVLRRECVLQDGSRGDVVIFAAWRTPRTPRDARTSGASPAGLRTP